MSIPVREITFNREQEEVLCAGLLGDSWISNPTKGTSKHSSLFIEHSTKQSAYCLFKAEMLGLSHLYRDRYDARTEKTYSSVMAYSQASPTYNELYHKIYGPDGHKHLNIDILNKLGPLGLSVLFFDDGHTDYNGRRCYLHTERFTLAEQQIIQTWFREKWGLNPTIQEKPSNGTMRYNLAFDVQDSYKLLQIITPFIPTPDVAYKCQTKPYSKPPQWLRDITQ